MLTARLSKILNDLLGHKIRTALIVSSIAVGLLAIGAILSTRSVLSDEMRQGYAAIHPSSFTIHTSAPVDPDFVRSVRVMPGVTDAGARRTINARIRTASGQWLALRLYALDYGDMRVNRVKPQSGAWPPPLHEMLIERAAIGLLGAQVGDTLTIEMPGGKSGENQQDLRIAGLTHDLAVFPARFTNVPYAYVSFDTLESLGEPYGYTEINVEAQDRDPAAVRRLADEVKDKAERTGLTVTSTSIDRFPLDDMVQTILLILSILGLLALGLSAFLIVNTISAQLAQQVRQIGIMKAIGARTTQIMGMYLLMVVLYGLLALIVAVPASIGGAYVFSRLATDLLNFDLTQFEMPPQTLAIQVGTGLVLPVAASIYPFLAGLRVTAAEAMSAYGPSRRSFGAGFPDRLLAGSKLWFARKVPGRSLLLSTRNTFRSKGRLALTLVTLAQAGAIFISVFSVRASLFRTINDLLQWRQYDSLVTLGQTYRVEELEAQARATPGVTQADYWLSLPGVRVRPGDTESDALFVYGLRLDSSLVSPPVLVQGRWLAPGDSSAVVVNTFFLKKEPDVRLGDWITLKLDGHKYEWQVVGVALGSSPPTVYASYPALARATGNLGRASAVLVGSESADPGAARQVASALEAQFKHAGIRTAVIETTAEERNREQSNYSILVIGLLVMAILFAIVGGLGLMGTMSINVLERTREIGVLRAIGAPDRSVIQVFVLESISIGMISWMLGLALAVPLSKVMSDAVGIPLMGTPITFQFSAEGVGIWLLVVALLSALASIVPARNASRLTVREVLAYE